MADSKAIRSIKVKLATDVSSFSKGMDKAGKDASGFKSKASKEFKDISASGEHSAKTLTAKFAEFGKSGLASVKSLTGGLVGLGTAVAGAVAGLTTMGIGRIQELAKDATAIGMTTEQLSRLRSVAKGVGVDVGDLSTFVKDLTSNVNNGIGKTTASTEALKNLGVTAEELAKLTPDQQIEKLIKGFDRLPNDAEKARVAMALSGESGVKVFRLLTQGADKFHASMDAAPVVTEDEVSEVRKLQITLDKLRETFDKFVTDLTVKVLPKVAEFADTILDLVKNIKSFMGWTTPAAIIGAGGMIRPAVASLPVAPAQVVPKLAPPAPAGSAKAVDAARARVAELEQRNQKQLDQIEKNNNRTVIRGQAVVKDSVFARQQRTQQATSQELNGARQALKDLEDGSKNTAQAMANAMRANMEMLKQVAEAKQEYRGQIETAGQDEIHRRVAGIKGISDTDRKALIQQGYRAREANKTTGLRDELTESLKMPQQKLAEDVARINRMVQLGSANGGLSREQGLRALAQRTQESGILEGPRYSGALDSRSVEGRSYLLNQFGGPGQDQLAIAKQGLAAAGLTNTLLGRIADSVGNARQADTYSF